jgi:hypothetical protein
MANEEHLAILRQDVEAWNRWREENPDVRPDLWKADLAGANLGGASLGGASLAGANLRGASLRGASLDGTYPLYTSGLGDWNAVKVFSHQGIRRSARP